MAKTRQTRQYLTAEQSNYLKGSIRGRGETMVTLAAKLGVAYGTLTGTINGYRANPEVRQKMATFLGEPVAILFPANGDLAAAATPPEMEIPVPVVEVDLNGPHATRLSRLVAAAKAICRGILDNLST